MRKYISGALALLLAALPMTAMAAPYSVPNGYGEDRQRLVLVGEPDGEAGVDRADSDYVTYYENNKEKDLGDIVWADGRDGEGQAMVLNGKGNYLSVGYNQLRLTNFSVSMWVNWQGGDDGANLLLISQKGNEDNYIALSPHYSDDEKNDAGYAPNGLYLDVMVEGKQTTAYKYSNPGQSTALPQNEWHHIAVVAKMGTISLYVDGEVWAETTWAIGLRELNADFLRIGDRLDMGSTLKAKVDDVAIYSSDLKEDQVKMLALGIDPLEEGAVLPPPTTTAPSTTTTEASSTTTVGTIMVLDQNGGKQQSLSLALTIGGTGLAIFALLTACSLIFGKNPKKKEDKE